MWSQGFQPSCTVDVLLHSVDTVQMSLMIHLISLIEHGGEKGEKRNQRSNYSKPIFKSILWSLNCLIYQSLDQWSTALTQSNSFLSIKHVNQSDIWITLSTLWAILASQIGAIFIRGLKNCWELTSLQIRWSLAEMRSNVIWLSTMTGDWKERAQHCFHCRHIDTLTSKIKHGCHTQPV